MKRFRNFIIYLVFAEIILLVAGIFMKVTIKDIVLEMILLLVTFGIGFVISKVEKSIRKYFRALKWINDPITQQALLVIGGKYGIGQDRVNQLTSEFSYEQYIKIQHRVNDLIKQYGDMAIKLARKYTKLWEANQ